ncbi:hypothetical protein ETB97_011354 [Aspergillus alliaceus]|uniref:Secreted protein n=1 Tax=Petromyces alliaceus TaxID=209559 RepID=A0A8H6E8M4_PETAA|nr:hypothetical protein ETB97_011354 [Aspergillus burnettii]
MPLRLAPLTLLLYAAHSLLAASRVLRVFLTCMESLRNALAFQVRCLATALTSKNTWQWSEMTFIPVDDGEEAHLGYVEVLVTLREIIGTMAQY